MDPSQSSELYRMYKGTRIPAAVLDECLDSVKTFEIRPDDILQVNYSKSGTHWMNEIIYLILVDGDAEKLDHRHRRSVMEVVDVVHLADVHKTKPSFKRMESDPSPRVIKTHLKPRYLPSQVWEKRIPIIYLIRDPRDVFLSFFEWLCGIILPNGEPYMKPGQFTESLANFVSGEFVYDGWCEHVKTFENIEKDQNIIFVAYEDLKKDLPSVIKRIAKHINREVNDGIITKIVENSSLNVMRKNYEKATKTFIEQESPEVEIIPLLTYVNKGIVGRWKSDISEDKWSALTETFSKQMADSKYAMRYFE